MAVSNSLTMPAQPSDGFVDYIPLGGDGFRTPFQMANVFFRSAGDASGGQHFVTLFIDPVYTWVIGWMEGRRTVAAAAADLIFNISPLAAGTFNQSYTELNATDQPVIFTPPPMLLETIDASQTLPRMSLETSNVNGENVTLTTQLWGFDKRARELGFLRDMFASVTRGVSQTG